MEKDTGGGLGDGFVFLIYWVQAILTFVVDGGIVESCEIGSIVGGINELATGGVYTLAGIKYKDYHWSHRDLCASE